MYKINDSTDTLPFCKIILVSSYHYSEPAKEPEWYSSDTKERFLSRTLPRSLSYITKDSLFARLVHVRDVYLTPPPPTSVPTHVEFSGRKAIAVADPILSVDRVSCPSLCVLV